MMEITICPVCESKLKKVRKDWKGEYQGKKYIVPELEYYQCENCGEKIYARESMRKIEVYSPAFEKSVGTRIFFMVPFEMAFLLRLLYWAKNIELAMPTLIWSMLETK